MLRELALELNGTFTALREGGKKWFLLFMIDGGKFKLKCSNEVLDVLY